MADWPSFLLSATLCYLTTGTGFEAYRNLKQQIPSDKESLGIGKNTVHRAVSLRQHGSPCYSPILFMARPCVPLCRALYCHNNSIP